MSLESDATLDPTLAIKQLDDMAEVFRARAQALRLEIEVQDRAMERMGVEDLQFTAQAAVNVHELRRTLKYQEFLLEESLARKEKILGAVSA